MKHWNLTPEEYRDESGTDFSPLDALNRSVIVCDHTGVVLFRNKFSAKEFPQIRCGTHISRFTPLRLADDKVSFIEFLGEKRFVLCSWREPDYFRLDIPGGIVADVKSAVIIRRMWDNTRFEPGRPFGERGQAALSSLAMRLVKCLESLEKDNEPRKNICVYDLFSAMSRRVRGPLDEIGAVFRFRCPLDLVCRASLADPAYTLLNVICFLTVYAGQKEVVAVAREKESFCEVSFELPDGGRAAEYLFKYFSPEKYSGLDLAPLVLAFEGAKRSGGSLSCYSHNGNTGILWRLPLAVGRAELTVLDPDAIVDPTVGVSLTELVRAAASVMDLS